MSDDDLEQLVIKSDLHWIIDDEYLDRGDWLPHVRVLVNLVQSAERERCAQYLRDSAARLAPEGKRINQIDRHAAHVLACKGDELAAGRAWRDVGEEWQK